MVVVVMGVSGVGKSTVGRALAEALRWRFLDGDELQPAANVDKMKHGGALDDADRAPWLATVAVRMHEAVAHGEELVVACSALKQSYRRRLHVSDEVRFVLLTAPEAVLRARVEARVGHFMPPSLLGSQLATLEPAGADELVVDSDRDVGETVAEIRAAIAR